MSKKRETSQLLIFTTDCYGLSNNYRKICDYKKCFFHQLRKDPSGYRGREQY